MAGSPERQRRSALADRFEAQLRWESPRTTRKRGTRTTGPAHLVREAIHFVDEPLRQQLTVLNNLASGCFVIGGALFIAGAMMAELTSLPARQCVLAFLAGGVFFTTGGWATFLQAVNAPGEEKVSRTGGNRAWRWWSYEPQSIDWLGTFLLFAGTCVFGVSLVEALYVRPAACVTDHFVWTPGLIGCLFFLLSGHLGLVEVCRGKITFRPHDLSWWIVVVNQAGSILFTVASIATYTRLATDSQLSTSLGNWTTALGAACFCLGGALQAFERPFKPTSTR